MSWYIEKRKDKYRFWSTVIDKFLTGWITKEEALEWLEYKYYLQFREKIEKEKKDFPSGWYDRKKGKIIAFNRNTKNIGRIL